MLYCYYFQVSVYLQNWSHVQSYVNKAESTPEVNEVRMGLIKLTPPVSQTQTTSQILTNM